MQAKSLTKTSKICLFFLCDKYSATSCLNVLCFTKQHTNKRNNEVCNVCLYYRPNLKSIWLTVTKYGTLRQVGCHHCPGTTPIFSVSFQFSVCAAEMRLAKTVTKNQRNEGTKLATLSIILGLT